MIFKNNNQLKNYNNNNKKLMKLSIKLKIFIKYIDKNYKNILTIVIEIQKWNIRIFLYKYQIMIMSSKSG